jgi:HD superfamily phosphohydrolase YqeK
MDELYGNKDVIVTGIMHDWFKRVDEAAAFFGFSKEELIAFARDELDYDLDEGDLELFKGVA